VEQVNDDIKIFPVTPSRWQDFELPFEGKGGPKNCWCMVWRTNEGNASVIEKSARKAAMREKILKRKPVGLLAYRDGEPIAWCSVAPRDTYRSLGGDENLEKVWSLVCFYIRAGFRRQGLTKVLIHAAISIARKKGGQYLEAYPVSASSPSYRFMGYRTVFSKLGFKFIGKAGLRRNVMIKKIN
jgi:GNAT superfamily N-acetyltransferase